MRVAIIGNSGSGKSTLARRLSEMNDLALLELDSIVWEPGKVAVQRDKAAIEADLHRFLSEHESWIVEGCYAELVEKVLSAGPELIFLNPGEAACIRNNRSRPWEPHKYASKEAQDAMLENLIAWVKDYYTRNDQWSLSAHRRLFDSYKGRKREVVSFEEGPEF